MTATTDLIANPIAFLERNILIPGIYGLPKDKLKDDPIDLQLAKMPASDGIAKKLGTELGIYIVTVPKLVPDIIKRGGEDAGVPFRSYFCSYEQGAVFGTVVGPNANFMFTAQMDGCSFGVGHANSKGQRLVFHANKGGDAKKQQADLDNKFGKLNQAAVLSPKDYRIEAGEAHLSSTTIGIRTASNNSWNFYAQIYADDKGVTNYGTRKQFRTYFLREVKKFL